MRRSYAVVITTAALILTACVSKPQVVYIPVYSCPKSEVPIEPSYEYNKLSDKDTPNKIAKAWVASMIQCKEYTNELVTIIRGYNSIAAEGIVDAEKR